MPPAPPAPEAEVAVPPTEAPAAAEAGAVTTPAPSEAPAVAEGALKIEPKAAEAMVTAAGLDYAALGEEIGQKGNLSDESMAKVKAALPGVPAEIISAYIEGEKAKAELATVQAERQVADGYAMAGGKDQYLAMAEWARNNLSSDEIDAYHASIDSGKASMKFAIEGLKARFAASKEPSLANRSAASAPGTPAIENMAQLRALIRDERYRTDPAFRANVERQLGQSKDSGRFQG